MAAIPWPYSCHGVKLLLLTLAMMSMWVFCYSKYPSSDVWQLVLGSSTYFSVTQLIHLNLLYFVNSVL